MRLLLLLPILLFLIGCQNSNTKQDSSLPSEMIEGKTPVKTASRFHGMGLFVGRPLESYISFTFDTLEAQIDVGSFHNSFYIGNSMKVSMESEAVFNQFKQLDKNQTYVFRFEKPYKLNPEIEKTHWLIRSIEPLQPDTKFEYRGVKKASEIEKTGNYSKGKKSGKIVGVKRWGFWDIDCSVELSMGALSKGDSSMFHLNHSIVLNVYSEEGCIFAEKALISGRDVIIKYTEDYYEWWDDYFGVMGEIRLSDDSVQPST